MNSIDQPFQKEADSKTFKKNIETLKKSYPYTDWQKIFKKVENKLPDGIEVLLSRSGDPTLVSHQQVVHSLYNPKKEAQKILLSLQNLSENRDGYIILGLGLGYLALELVRQHKDKPIIIIEPELHILNLALSLQDLSEIFSDPNVHLCYTQHTEPLVSLIAQLNLHTVHTLPNSTLSQRLPCVYDALQKSINFTLMCKNVNRKTLKEQGKLWMRNLCFNLNFFAEIPGIYHLNNIFNDIPALLIAAGPSLDTLWSYIHDLYHRCVFICVDTALRSLLIHGIEPDFVVSIDSQYWNSRHFDYCQTTRKSILIADPSLYSSVFRKKESFSFFLTSSLFPFGKYIENHLEIKGQLISGGSVATSAFDLCRLMKVNSIWIIGLDLGYPESCITHVQGSRAEVNAFNNQNRFNPVENTFTRSIYDSFLSLERPGYYGQTIRTDRRMEIYRLWFENQAKTYECYNLSLGVKIQDIPPAHYHDILNRFPINRPKINTICKSLHQITTKKTLLNVKLQVLRKKLYNELQQIITLCQQAQQEISQLDSVFTDPKKMQLSLSKLTHLDFALHQNPSHNFVTFLLDSDHSYQYASQKIPQIATNEKILKKNSKICESSKIMYQKISENALFFLTHLEL